MIRGGDLMSWLSLFFFFSGLCSIVYELVWLRLAMAKFGVTTALVSIVLSVFMTGLGAGAWLAGAAMRRYGERMRLPPLRLYGAIELAIGISALLVPLELEWGSHLLDKATGAASISSGSYYLLSGLWLAITLTPWCICMGATIPVAMFFIGSRWPDEGERSFSLLYLANVVGAVAGACLAPALIEIFGFHGTLRTGAILNVLIFASAMLIAARFQPVAATALAPSSNLARSAEPVQNDDSVLGLLFTTGLVTMGSEIVWIRLFTYFIGPVVYSFAQILASYLAATFVGSKIYRIWSRRQSKRDTRILWISLALFGLMPLVTADPRLAIYPALRVILGVAPFSGVIGFLTPMLVDRWAEGDPDRAGRAYAVNVLGCIIGPLLAGFVLLPLLGEHISMLILVVPWLGIAMFTRKDAPVLQTATATVVMIAAMIVVFFSRDYQALYRDRITLRDSTATTIAAGEGMKKSLLVNGVGMTNLTPITKMMAHFTFAHLPQPPRNALIICFGMGTTFRSAMSWGIPVTAVELVPSVPRLFTFFHPDGSELLNSERAHIVIDDGRRFMSRSSEKFDAIIIDPPPPINAAGSSLLYSKDFYMVAKDHLRPGGILQQWFFTGDAADKVAVTRALMQVFPYIRIYGPVDQSYGYHFLASETPIPELTAPELIARIPPAALADMLEWGPAKTPEQQLNLMLTQEFTPDQLIALSPQTPVLEDDRPINEYDRLRELLRKKVEAAEPDR